jgi:H+-transporting ATPase
MDCISTAVTAWTLFPATPSLQPEGGLAGRSLGTAAGPKRRTRDGSLFAYMAARALRWDDRVMSDPVATPAVTSDAPSDGLTDREVLERRGRFGVNSVPEQRPSAVRAFLKKVIGPVPWMLEVALVIQILQRRWTEAAIVAFLLFFNAFLSFFQERRARGALDLLRQRLRVTTRVNRNGVWTILPAEELVPDDVVHVQLGDLVPADLRLDRGAVLLDQAALTGEAAPVDAQSGSIAYAGSVVRRGEATGTVTATGAKSYFGKAAQLVGIAKSASQLEQLIRGIVTYLVVLDGIIAALVLIDALSRSLPLSDVIPFVLMLLVASVPVALPATFTLASALGAIDLANKGVLVTRLAAIEEAAAMQVLCSDKTGTLTENRLTLVGIHPQLPFTEDQLLEYAASACDEAGQDPIDLAILSKGPRLRSTARISFLPFDPATKRAEAVVQTAGTTLTIVKGAPLAVEPLVGKDVIQHSGAADAGERVLAVAVGPEGALRLAGYLSFRDSVRKDSKDLVRALGELGVRVLMITGDATGTAVAVARELQLGTRVCGRDRASSPLECDVFAGVLPDDKFTVVRALQASKQVVGMTGDGVNDAPALKQAEVGIAVESAVDVAKAAASIVLTKPGLAGVVAAVEGGRSIYQRMLTYTLNKIVKTLEVGLFLGIGFFMTGTMVVTPRQILLLLFTNDFVTMSIATDRVVPSPRPERWNVRDLMVTGALLALGWLLLSLGTVGVARWALGFPMSQVQTAGFLVLVLGGQANVYLVRERRRFWQSRPSSWLLLASGLDLAFVTLLVTRSWLMPPVPGYLVALIALATIAVLVLLDAIKVRVYRTQPVHRSESGNPPVKAGVARVPRF